VGWVGGLIWGGKAWWGSGMGDERVVVVARGPLAWSRVLWWWSGDPHGLAVIVVVGQFWLDRCGCCWIDMGCKGTESGLNQCYN
jgi:hypothetical protein